MADIPTPAHPPTPGADKLGKIPKWAWILGGSGLVGALVLFEHNRAQDQANQNDPSQTNPTDPTGVTYGDPQETVDPSSLGYAPAVGGGYGGGSGAGVTPVYLPATDPNVGDPGSPGSQLPTIIFPIVTGLPTGDPSVPPTGGGLPDRPSPHRRTPAHPAHPKKKRPVHPAHPPAGHQPRHGPHHPTHPAHPGPRPRPRVPARPRPKPKAKKTPRRRRRR